MIEPTKDDIGRWVVYLPNHPTDSEVGVISSFNEHLVFVRYSSKPSGEGTHRGNLEWRFPKGGARSAERPQART